MIPIDEFQAWPELIRNWLEYLNSDAASEREKREFVQKALEIVIAGKAPPFAPPCS
jgi:hypothetical protein